VRAIRRVFGIRSAFSVNWARLRRDDNCVLPGGLDTGAEDVVIEEFAEKFPWYSSSQCAPNRNCVNFRSLT